MVLDLHTLSRAELEQLRIDVEKALSGLAERERRAALDAAIKAAADYGFSLDELTADTSLKLRARGKSKNPAKYRNPANPEQTWTGRGRKPQWIKDAEANGIDIETFTL